MIVYIYTLVLDIRGPAAFIPSSWLWKSLLVLADDAGTSVFCCETREFARHLASTRQHTPLQTTTTPQVSASGHTARRQSYLLEANVSLALSRFRLKALFCLASFDAIVVA